MGFKDKSNYDDMGFSSPRRREDRDRMDKRSLRIIVLVVILGILLCAAVVLIWVIYFSSGEVAPPKPQEQRVVTSDVPIEEPPKEEVVIKTPTPAPVVATPQTQSGWYQEYTVQEGDTLETIIEEFAISRETILSVNPIKSIQEIKPGFILRIPSRNGQLYTVQPGDSLSIITNRFNPTLGWKTLQEINGLKSENILPGQKIFIPSPDTEARSYYTRFIRPTEGRTSGSYNQTVLYGEQYVTLKGVLIDGVAGSDVKASASGVVVDVGNEVDGLGRLVVLSHDQGYKTTYAHLQEVVVKVGSQVKQGETIALLGESGNVGRPSLYFQIEEEGIPLDPANFF